MKTVELRIDTTPQFDATPKEKLFRVLTIAIHKVYRWFK
jgi:hypothetical protein